MKHRRNISVGAFCIILFFAISFLIAQEGDIAPCRTKRHSIGVGFGIPYGFFGLNLDINLAPNLNITGGVGTSIIAGMAYNAGLKLFLVPSTWSFRPRISGYYGTNTIVMITEFIWIFTTEECKTYTGTSVGFGAQWMLGKTRTHGVDFDILYIVSSNFDVIKLLEQGYYVQDEGRNGPKFSIGYRYAF